MSRRTLKRGLFSLETPEALRDQPSDPPSEQMPVSPSGSGSICRASANLVADTFTQDRMRNELTTEKYQYTPLEGNALSIRLLELLQGTRQEDIAVRLYETNLDERAGSYEALSYVWGDTSEKTPILIDEQSLEIGADLRCALLNLRLLDEPRTLWVDAISIDQTNVEERNQQVAAMGEIYRRASKTIIWLGDQEKETAAAFSMLEELAEEATSLAQAGSSPSDAASTEDEDLMAHLNSLPVSIMERDDVNTPMFNRHKGNGSIIHIVARPWWYRAWTIQEILLASRATVMAGRHTIDWDHFCIGGNHGLKLGLWMPLTMGIILDRLVLPYLSLQSLRWRRRLQNPNAKPAQALLELLISCRFRQATDSRDKIYSLLGLLANPGLPSHDPTLSPPLGIRPDYASPVSDIYTHTARQIMLESGTLDLLGACPSPAAPSLALPSWAPDWSLTDLAAMPLMRDAFSQPRSTHATRYGVASPRFVDAGATLVLQAHEVTTLEALAPPLARIQFCWTDEIKRRIGYATEVDGRVAAALATVVRVCKVLAINYEALMSVVPHLATYAEWEEFARAVPPTNPVPCAGGVGSKSKPAKPRETSSASNTIGSLVNMTGNLSIATGITASAKEEEEPEDALAVYWQTLCTGTYATDADAVAPGRGRKIATQRLFYSWRASLEPIRNLHRWRAERMLRPLGFIGYVRKTWRGYGEFMRFIEGAYERRLARGANEYLCLVPATAAVGDSIVLARGGRVPLVVRRDGGSGCWRFVGEAYVQGIMEGQGWDESKCVDFKVR